MNIFNKIRIPPLPEGTVLTDRADGTLWLVSHTFDPPGPDGNGYITITDTWTLPNPKVYGAYDEPYVEIRALNEPYYAQLMVRGGYLGVDIKPLPRGVHSYNNAPGQSRREVRRHTDSIYAPITWRAEHFVLAWSPEDLVP